MSNTPTRERREDAAHLDDLEDGCGCAEVWEHLSEWRRVETAPEDRVDGD